MLEWDVRPCNEMKYLNNDTNPNKCSQMFTQDLHKSHSKVHTIVKWLKESGWTSVQSPRELDESAFHVFFFERTFVITRLSGNIIKW